MMKKICKILLGVGAFAVGFAATALLGSKELMPVAANSDTNVYNNNIKLEEMLVKPDYPVNEHGKTYGGVANVMPEDYPDLVAVTATNGKDGYARVEDFNDEYIAKSPEDAVRYMEKLKELNDQGYFFQVIPVYEVDGTTVIGEFEISIDVGLCYDGTANQKVDALERQKLYEESRKQGKVLRESIKTIMEE